jgi:hypothetical protein
MKHSLLGRPPPAACRGHARIARDRQVGSAKYRARGGATTRTTIMGARPHRAGDLPADARVAELAPQRPLSIVFVYVYVYQHATAEGAQQNEGLPTLSMSRRLLLCPSQWPCWTSGRVRGRRVAASASWLQCRTAYYAPAEHSIDKARLEPAVVRYRSRGGAGDAAWGRRERLAHPVRPSRLQVVLRSADRT